MIFKLLDFLGLMIAFVGAVTLAWGLIVSKKQALTIGVSRIAEETDEQNIKLPRVRDRLRESRFALFGLVLLSIGFLLQLIGSWPKNYP